MLADWVHENSFKKPVMPFFTDQSNYSFRTAIRKAEKFVLDEPSSRMLARLASAAAYVGDPIQFLESMRRACVPPFPVTWVEYNTNARYSELRKVMEERKLDTSKLARDDERPIKSGWLIERHPNQHSAFRATIVMGTDSKSTDLMPWAMGWDTADQSCPWEQLAATKGIEQGRLLTGHDGYNDPCVWYCRNFGDFSSIPLSILEAQVRETIGELRYILAFFAALNGGMERKEILVNRLPSERVIVRDRTVDPLQYKEVTLHIPKHLSPRQVVARGVSSASRGQHDIGAFWRTYRAGDGSCKPLPFPFTGVDHRWEVIDEKHRRCTTCDAHAVNVVEHKRGDPNISVIKHTRHTVKV